MADSRRLTTDRFYGGTSERIELLSRFLAYVESQHPSLSEAQDWILSNTDAQSRDAIERHLNFLDALDLINFQDRGLTLADRGDRYLESSAPSVLYEALRENVKGFDTILRRLQEEPLTDEDIMDLLVSEFEDINMESPGVATRHREWLQVLGYVDRSDGVNRLTEVGRELADEVLADARSMTASRPVSELRRRLLQSEMACVPAGEQDLTDDVYPAVENAYPHLCDDSYRCGEAHENGRDQPEWKHAVRDIQQRIADQEWGRVRRVDKRGTWLFLPRFEVSETFQRSDLHDRFGGQRQRGISPCRKLPLILLFTSFAETDQGYRDTIQDDGTVIYTGEGVEGDMTYDHGNKAVGDHQEDGRELHLFETIDDGEVRYVGQYRCVDWFRQDLPDANEETRSAIRFELEPVNKESYSEPPTPEPSDIGESEADEEASPEDVDLPPGTQTTDRRETTRSSIVRDESLVRRLKALYDDTCQVCGDRRRQSPSDGFSNVHHLMPLGEPHNGPDVPENVLVVCPNHHDDFENGMLTIDPQTLEVDHVYEDSLTGKTIETKGDHQIGPQYVAYHNQVRALGED